MISSVMRVGNEPNPARRFRDLGAQVRTWPNTTIRTASVAGSRSITSTPSSNGSYTSSPHSTEQLHVSGLLSCSFESSGICPGKAEVVSLRERACGEGFPNFCQEPGAAVPIHVSSVALRTDRRRNRRPSCWLTTARDGAIRTSIEAQQLRNGTMDGEAPAVLWRNRDDNSAAPGVRPIGAWRRHESSSGRRIGRRT